MEKTIKKVFGAIACLGYAQHEDILELATLLYPNEHLTDDDRLMLLTYQLGILIAGAHTLRRSLKNTPSQSIEKG